MRAAKAFNDEGYDIRLFQPKEWADYRDISFEMANAYPASITAIGREIMKVTAPHQWQAELEDSSNMILALRHNEVLVGFFCTLMRDNAVHFYLTYLRDGHHGKGLADECFARGMEWARANGKTEITLSHRAGHANEIRLVERHGFKETQQTAPWLWSDGTYAAIVHRSLALK